MKDFIHKTTSILLIFAVLVCHLPQTTSALDAPWLTAQAAVMIDATTGRAIYGKNLDTMMVPASMTKVMTAYIVFQEIYEGNLSLSSQIPITQTHRNLASTFGGSSLEIFPANTTISVDLLLKMILLPSSCVACRIIADYISGSEAAFVQRMNATALSLGMEANYQNCHGYFAHYLTARSQARLIQVFIQEFPQILNYTSLTSVTYNGNTFKNTNKLLSGGDYYYQGADGFKTGTITASGHCLSATAEKNGVRLITVVMNADGNAGRYGDTTKLLNYGFALMAQENYSFFDVDYLPEVTPHYEKYRNVSVYLQGKHGWIRPTEAMTRGEFAVTLMTVLEENGLIEKVSTRPNGVTEVIDLNFYFGGEKILRGLEMDFFPWKGELFYPNTLLTPEEMRASLVMCQLSLGLSSNQQYTSSMLGGLLGHLYVKVLSSEIGGTVRRGDALLAIDNHFFR